MLKDSEHRMWWKRFWSIASIIHSADFTFTQCAALNFQVLASPLSLPPFFHRSESPTKIERHHNGAFFFLRKRKEESNLNSISRERRRREAEKEYLRLQLIVVNRAETSEAKRKLDFREWRWIISMRLYLAGTGCVTLLQSSVFFHSPIVLMHSFIVSSRNKAEDSLVRPDAREAASGVLQLYAYWISSPESFTKKPSICAHVWCPVYKPLGITMANRCSNAICVTHLPKDLLKLIKLYRKSRSRAQCEGCQPSSALRIHLHY